jgi:hypothetical protein
MKLPFQFPRKKSRTDQWKLEHVLHREAEDPMDSSLFEYKGSALLVPLLHWLRDANWYVSTNTVEGFYGKVYAPFMGALDDFSQEQKSKVLDFAYAQLVYRVEVEPIIKQALLVFDDVFLVFEREVPESTATAPFDPANEALRPRIAKGIGNPDIILLPWHLMLGFLARILAVADNKDRRLRMPGWKAERNLDHLKNVNHAVNELGYMIGMFDRNVSFSLLVPDQFQRVMKRKMLGVVKK